MCLVLIMIWQSSWPRCVQTDMVEMFKKPLMNMNYRAILGICVVSEASEIPNGEVNRTFWSRI